MLHVIASQIGQVEHEHGEISPAVLSYLAAAGLDASGSRCPPWAAALLSWAAVRSGIEPPEQSGDAAKWLTWGAPLAQPQAGAVLVLTSGGRPGLMCGVAARVAGGKVYVIGAFDGAVQTRAFPIEQVIAARSSRGASAIEDMPQAHAPPPDVEQAVAPPPPAIESLSPAHLEALLSVVRAEFADVHTRIDHIQQTAIGAVSIREAL